uniref:Uncharacterized protein n=1 Tax=Zea mays TaxID=4577 RepID=B6U5U0_MAIZE|nr:hypothetical protein [Zea mays]
MAWQTDLGWLPLFLFFSCSVLCFFLPHRTAQTGELAAA